MLSRAIATLSVWLSASHAVAQESTNTTVPAAEIRQVSSGAFNILEGDGLYVEEINNQILLTFPSSKLPLRDDAVWPAYGLRSEQKKCTKLREGEHLITVSGRAWCIRQGDVLDPLRMDYTDASTVAVWNGGCAIGVVRIDRIAERTRILLRADCTKLELLSTSR